MKPASSFLALQLLPLASAIYEPLVEFCKIIDHQSAVKNGTLYIDGGRQIFSQRNAAGNDTFQINGLNKYLFALDMTKTWDVKVNPAITAIPKPDGVPYLVRGALYDYPTENKLLSFGGTVAMDNTSFIGWRAPQDESKSIYTYDIAANSWKSTDLTPQGLVRPSSGASALVPDKGLAFYYSGLQDWGSSVQSRGLNDTTKFLDGMIVLDMATNKARNLSTSAVSNRARVRGELIHVPLPNTDGILVLLGGGEKPSNDLTHEWKGELVPFGSVDIFDVGSLTNSSNGTWMTQSVVGTPPAPRLDPCVIMQAAPDKSSYNIYMFGGRDGVWGYYDDVWMLTMPSFRWIQVGRAKGARYGMTCHAFGRQMVVVGGSDWSNLTAKCDQTPISVFDMIDMTWSTKFDSNLGNYQVPVSITKFIGGSPSGGATARSPVNGWTNDKLRVLFNAGGSASTGGNTSSSGSSGSSGSSMNAGAIAGGVIGGLAGLAIIFGFIFLCVRRRRETERLAEERRSMWKDHSYSPVAQVPSEPVSVKETKQAHVATQQHLDSSEVYELRAAGNDAHLAEAPSIPPAELP